jgi:hypothetical protein
VRPLDPRPGAGSNIAQKARASYVPCMDKSMPG